MECKPQNYWRHSFSRTCILSMPTLLMTLFLLFKKMKVHLSLDWMPWYSVWPPALQFLMVKDCVIVRVCSHSQIGLLILNGLGSNQVRFLIAWGFPLPFQFQASSKDLWLLMVKRIESKITKWFNKPLSLVVNSKFAPIPCCHPFLLFVLFSCNVC